MVNEINIDLRKEPAADWQKSKGVFVPNLKKFHQSVLEISCSQWEGWADNPGEKRKPAINPSNNSACCGLNSSYSSLLVAF